MLYKDLLLTANKYYDFVFVARSKTKYVKSTQLALVMLSQLKQAGVINEEADN